LNAVILTFLTVKLIFVLFDYIGLATKFKSCIDFKLYFWSWNIFRWAE